MEESFGNAGEEWEDIGEDGLNTQLGKFVEDSGRCPAMGDDVRDLLRRGEGGGSGTRVTRTKDKWHSGTVAQVAHKTKAGRVAQRPGLITYQQRSVNEV